MNITLITNIYSSDNRKIIKWSFLGSRKERGKEHLSESHDPQGGLMTQQASAHKILVSNPSTKPTRHQMQSERQRRCSGRRQRQRGRRHRRRGRRQKMQWKEAMMEWEETKRSGRRQRRCSGRRQAETTVEWAETETEGRRQRRRGLEWSILGVDPNICTNPLVCPTVSF